jgi:hypothetical protein
MGKELVAFLFGPLLTSFSGLMFNTGDLARWLEDGSLEPLGRKDEQVKISGFRVELDGVSRAIEKCPTIIKGCALKIGDKLWGFYSAPAPIDQQELKAVVGHGLPFYAVPTVWKWLPVIQLTPNGKVDKRALKAVAEGESHPILDPQSIVLANTEASKPLALELATPRSIKKHLSLTFDVASPVTLVDSQENWPGLEKGEVEIVDGEPEEFELPKKKGFHGWRWIRHRGLSAYRKLFGIIFLSNLAVFVWMLWESRQVNFSLPTPHIATAVAANLLCAVLLRQDYVVNLIFWACSRLSTSFPLSIRRHFARVYHNGGVHSGCAVSASVWWIIFTGAATGNAFSSNPAHPIDMATLLLSYLILLLLMAILIMAYPAIRAKLHNQFECTHRFAGWTALALVWAHVILSANSASTLDRPFVLVLFTTPSLYLIFLATLSIALPWMRLRRVKVVPEPLSKHAVRLHFDFITPGPCTSRGVRITDRPLVEWHAFAAIPEPSGKGFSIIVSKAGDWTKKIIENPPTSIWTRGTPASGVLAVAPLFKKVVLVATGSGIGPCMPVLMERRVPARVLWSTKNPLKTYGQGVMDTLLAADPDALIWDSDHRGRPDLVKLAYQLYKESGAECVCIISNGPTTNKFVYQMESRGVPAFGPIWDS